MRYLIALPVLAVFAVYNAWALVTLWNTWLQGIYPMTWPVAFGVFFVGCWVKPRGKGTEKDHEWNMAQAAEHEIFSPVCLVIVSTILHRLIY